MLVIGDPHLCSYRLADDAADADVEPPLPEDTPLAADAVSETMADARAKSQEVVQSLEAEVGVSVEQWRARLTAQAAAAAAEAGITVRDSSADLRKSARQTPVGATSAAARDRRNVFGDIRSLFIRATNVQINNSVTVNVGTAGGPQLSEAKAALIRSLLGVDGGARATAAQVSKVEALARSLEAVNPTSAPLRSPLISGRWQLQYTTETADGRSLRPSSTFFTLDIFALKLLREDVYTPLFLRWTLAAVADLLPRSDARCALRYRGFRVAGVDLPAPPQTPSRAALSAESAVLGGGDVGEAWLTVTYLDFDLQLQRSSSGALIVLTRAE